MTEYNNLSCSSELIAQSHYTCVQNTIIPKAYCYREHLEVHSLMVLESTRSALENNTSMVHQTGKWHHMETTKCASLNSSAFPLSSIFSSSQSTELRKVAFWTSGHSSCSGRWHSPPKVASSISAAEHNFCQWGYS